MPQDPSPNPASSRLLSRWDIVPATALLGNGLLFLALRGQFPERIPVHWSLSGQPNRWVTPAQGLAEGLALGLGLWLLFLFLAWTGKGPGSPSLGRTLEPMRAFMPTGAFLMGAALLARPVLGEASLGLGIGALLLSNLCGLLVGLVRTPHEVWDPPKDDPSQRAEGCWKAGGLFYVNPKDPRMIVPKREGGGWTYNLAHRKAQVVMIGLLTLPLLIFLVTYVAQKG